MSDKLSCSVVRDLLPSYVDGLVSDETKTEVNEHLSTCEACTEIYNGMKEPEKQAQQEEKQIDYLKRTKKHVLLRILLCVAAAVVLVAGVLTAWFRISSTSKNFDIYGLMYDVSVNGKDAYIMADLADSWRGTKIKATEKDGVLLVTVTASPGGSSRSTLNYSGREDITEVRIGDYIVWQNGCFLDPTAARLYHAKNPYVGDISADLKIAGLLGVEQDFGSFTNELHTSEEPYGWTIRLGESIPERNQLSAESIMDKDSKVLLALIDNLGYIEWEYTVNGETLGYVCSKDNLEGKNADTPNEFYDLLSSLNFKSRRLSENTGERSFRITVRLQAENTEILGLAVTSYYNGKGCSTQGGHNADNSLMKTGDALTFEITDFDLPEGVSSFDLSTGYSFSLSAYDLTGQDIFSLEERKLSARFGEDYVFSLVESGGEYKLISEN